jgi:hypothetical protein
MEKGWGQGWGARVGGKGGGESSDHVLYLQYYTLLVKKRNDNFYIPF